VETKNAVIGDGAKVPHLSYVGDAEIGEGTNIGAGTIFANYDGVKKHRTTVGRHARTASNNTFVAPVEIGDGAKVPHLSYVGDAEIGEGANIGAGTIFANYDGVDKHRTKVGKHAKTASNNTFVAPVEIGDGAGTGAGAVVRRDVPPGALAVSAGPQRNLPGWAQTKRAGTEQADAAAAASQDDGAGIGDSDATGAESS